MTEDPLDADAVDQAFLTLATGASTGFPIIACLYTGKLPDHCAPMPRNPCPAIGLAIDEGLSAALIDAVRLNDAVHDGAIMFGRQTPALPYQVTGWSYRMFPPEGQVAPTANRGSAFHSSLSMSLVVGVDRVYLVSNGSLHRFENGRWAVFD